MSSKHRFTLIRIICSAVLFLAGMIIDFSLPLLSQYVIFFYILAALTVGYDVILNAINGIVHGHVLDENFLMTVGSICAFILSEYAEGTVILLLYQIGELFQGIAVGKSRNSIKELMNICPDEARLENGDIVDPFEISVGDIILIEPGEKIPLDGEIIEGCSNIDTSSLTGEHIPSYASVGSSVISGCINLTSPIKVRVTKEFSESTVSKILELVENASMKKATMESFVTRFAKYYTPCVVIAALLIAILPPLLFSLDFKTWVLRAVMFIVISCPCALVVSVPLSFFGALGSASRIGVLVKGSNYLEALSQLDTVMFDKTGTLTEGKFKITEIHTQNDVSKEEVLKSAVLCEYHSSHPIAISIKSSTNEEIMPEPDMQYENIAGKGVVVKQNDRILLAGNQELMKAYGFEPSDTPHGFTVVHIADRKYLGYILLDDKLKESSKNAILALKNCGITNTVILSGDRKDAVNRVADSLNIDTVFAELLPDNKVEIAEKIITEASGKVAFVGDGVNDAPVLARVDVGVAMGALGSDAAIEAADVVIMNDELSLLARAIKISKKAVRISKQNIIFSLVIKFTQLILSLIGLGTIWMAVFADVGVLIIAIANSMRNLSEK